MGDKITRREALKGIFFTGMGIATSGMLLKSQVSSASTQTHTIPWKEAPAGTKIDSRTWDKMGETLGMLGLGCMRLPTLSVIQVPTAVVGLWIRKQSIRWLTTQSNTE